MSAIQEHETLTTHPAPPKATGGTFTVVPMPRTEELRDQRRAIRRLLLLGTCVWPFFVLADFVGGVATGYGPHVVWILTWRLLGSLLGALAYFTVRDVELRASQLRLIDAGVFVIGTVLLSIIALPFGGMTSRLLSGVIVFVFARAALVPSHWRQALAVSMLSVVAMPITLGIASIFIPSLRAQWASGVALLLFAHNAIAVLAAAVVGSVGSHIVWSARKQVYELRKLGSYRLKSCIGVGGVGEVWLAWQNPPGREVALKVLRGHALEDPYAVRRFNREARAASRLTHPNTIRVFDFGETEDGVRYIAMELLHGLNVDGVVRDYGPMLPARAIHLARQACASLAEAHARGVIHRDLKPANLFVVRSNDGEDTLKVLDFGLARVIHAGTSDSSPSPLTPEGIVCGTPAFISPEAISGAEVDARSDLYSLGAVLYFMVTGTVVFPHLGFDECLVAHMERVPEPPSARVQGIGKDLEEVILRCLAKRPRDRYPSADALSAALASCADAGRWTPRDTRAFWERADGGGAHSITQRVSPR